MANATWYPSFGPDDFPACHEAAQEALQLARQAVAADTTHSQVSRLPSSAVDSYHLIGCLLTLPEGPMPSCKHRCVHV